MELHFVHGIGIETLHIDVNTIRTTYGICVGLNQLLYSYYVKFKRCWTFVRVILLQLESSKLGLGIP